LQDVGSFSLHTPDTQIAGAWQLIPFIASHEAPSAAVAVHVVFGLSRVMPKQVAPPVQIVKLPSRMPFTKPHGCPAVAVATCWHFFVDGLQLNP
jgi:hypothetical protein